MVDFGLIILFFVCVVFRDRVYLPLPIVDAEVPVLELPLVIAAFSFAVYRFPFCVPALRSKVAALWTPYLLLGAVLPIFGILFGDYKITSLYAIVHSFALAFASLLLGIIAFGNNPGQKRRAIDWTLNGGVMLQFILSMVQFARILGFSHPIITMVTEWDIAAQSRLKEEYVILGRSVGTYISPNVLGVWAMAAFFWNIICGKGASRIIFSGLSLITIFLSQARGSGFAFLAALGFYLVIASSPNRSMSGGIKAIAATSFLLVVGVVAIAFIIPDFSLLPGVDRWQEGFNVLSRGAEADANFAGRIEVWREALVFMREYPLGTFGPPQVLFVLPPDNQYVHLLLQGSIVYLVSFLIGLTASIALVFRPSREAALVATFSVAIAVNSVSALPLFYPPGLLFWFFLGFYLNTESHFQMFAMSKSVSSSDVVTERSRRTNVRLPANHLNSEQK